MTAGKFITIDGTEGSGKSTQIARITAYLEQAGKIVYATREPGGTAVGEKIRDIFLTPELAPTPRAELLLIFAARCQHLEQEIWPRLYAGEWIISDRFNDATYAYQGAGRGIPAGQIRALEEWIQDRFQPDLSLILTLPEHTAAGRLAQRGGTKDRMENQGDAFFQRVAAGYLERSHAPYAALIDASGSPDAVFANIKPSLDRLLRA